MTKKKKDIIDQKQERYGLFVNDQSNDLDINYGRHFLQTDNVHFIYLFKVNVIESKSHNLYGQAKAKDKVYSKPIKLNVMVDIEEPKQEQYGGSGLIRDDSGKLTFGVYLKELQEKGIDIERGDIVRYNMSGEKNRYYEVEFANNVNDTPEYSFGGFYNYWKKIIAVPVKGDTLPIDDDMYDFDTYDRNSGTQQLDNSSVVWQEPVTRVPEAPLDGNQYGRQDGEWTIIIHPQQLQTDWNQNDDSKVDYLKNKPFIIPEAPVDGSQYIRKDGDWQEVTIPDQFPEAPVDGNQYVRQNANWSLIVIPDQVQPDWNQTGVTQPDYIKNKPFIIPEAPVDGNSYVRKNETWNLLPNIIADSYIVYNETELLDAWNKARIDTNKSATIYIGGAINLTANRTFNIGNGQARIKFSGVTGGEAFNIGNYILTLSRLTVENLIFTTTSNTYLHIDQSYIDLYNVRFFTDSLYSPTLTNMKTHIKCVGSIINGTGKIFMERVTHITNNATWNSSGDVQPIIISNNATNITNPSRLYVEILKVDSVLEYNRFSRLLLTGQYITNFRVTGDLSWYYHPSQVFSGGIIDPTSILLKRGSVDDLRGDYIPSGNITKLIGIDTDYNIRLTELINAFPEAPLDGNQYSRQDGDWSLITIPDQVQPDWNQTGVTQPDYIKNKPTLYKNFTDLDDVIPENYFGKAKNVPIVTDDETMLDLIATEELETVQAKFTHLSDVPQTYGGSGGNMVIVNGTEDGLVFIPVPQQQQANWTQTGSSEPSYIRNKPDIGVVKATNGDTTNGHLSDKIVAGLNTSVTENINVTGNTISINSFLSEISFEWCINAGLVETFKIDRYSTNGYKIIKAVLESDAVVNGVNININGVPVNGLNNMSVNTTITVFEAIDTNIANIGDIVTLTTIGNDSGTPTLIGGKIILG